MLERNHKYDHICQLNITVVICNMASEQNLENVALAKQKVVQRKHWTPSNKAMALWRKPLHQVHV